MALLHMAADTLRESALHKLWNIGLTCQNFCAYPLVQSLKEEELPLQPVESYYTRPHQVAVGQVDYDRFWSGEKRLTTTLEPLPPLSTCRPC